jgi:hypothetical protein
MAASTVIHEPVSDSTVADGNSQARCADAGAARQTQSGKTIHLEEIFMRDYPVL